MLRIGTAVFGVGVVHGAAYVGHAHDPVATTERFLLDPRIQAVEGGWDLAPEAAEDLRRRFLWSGCDVVYTVGGFMRRQQIDPSAPTAEARREAREKLMRHSQAASGYGAAMLLLCTGPDTEPERRAEAIGHFGKTVEALCAETRRLRPERPMWITVEHFDRELDQKRLLGPTAETAALLADIRRRHDNVGMTLDLSHLVQLGEDIDEAVATMEDEFAQVRAEAGCDASLDTIVVPDAIDLLRKGDAETHNRLVAARAPDFAGHDAIMLAHFSTSRAAEAVRAAVGILVLSAPEAAVLRMRALVTGET